MPNNIEHTKKQLLVALEKSLGVVTTACKEVDISRTTYYDYYNNDAEFRKAVNDISNIALDFTESKLFKQIDGGNMTGIIFYLKTKGKKRGYVERQEISGPDEGPIQTQSSAPDFSGWTDGQVRRYIALMEEISENGDE